MSVIVEAVALRSGLTADWAAATAPILGVGELGLDTQTGVLKIGDGAAAFTALPGGIGNLKSEGKATLVTGAKVVNDAKVTATSIILLTTQALGTVTAPKAIAVTARSAGVSFTITSADNTDTSIVGYQIIEP